MDKTNRAIKICRRIEQIEISLQIVDTPTAANKLKIELMDLENELAKIDVASSVTPEVRIDMALDSILKASGSALRYYSVPRTLANMREAMRKIMSDSYISGSNDCAKALKKRYT